MDVARVARWEPRDFEIVMHQPVGRGKWIGLSPKKGLLLVVVSGPQSAQPDIQTLA